MSTETGVEEATPNAEQDKKVLQQQKDIAKLFGKMPWDGDLNAMRSK